MSQRGKHGKCCRCAQDRVHVRANTWLYLHMYALLHVSVHLGLFSKVLQAALPWNVWVMSQQSAWLPHMLQHVKAV